MQQHLYTTTCGKTVLVKRKFGLKRLTLRFSKRQKAFVVSAPIFTSFSSITDFIDGAGAWFAKVDRYHQQAKPRMIVPGQMIPLLGKSVRVNFIESCQEKVLLVNGILEVYGVRSKFEKLLIKHLKGIAFEKFTHYSNLYAQNLSVSFKKLVVKEMKTRFGSCTSLGNLNYSWRVIFAPEPILAYLCAHEVCHLKEMNHSKRFWKLVGLLCPAYKQHKKWLKEQGKELFILV